jgi:outer membrane protein OmpA-like peptidoglycan-associated protein
MITRESGLKATDFHRRAVVPSNLLRKHDATGGAGSLRQRLGNYGVGQLMNEISRSSNRSGSPTIQAKLTISEPGEAHEQEADRVANEVMRMADSSAGAVPAVSSAGTIPDAQRKCTECDEEAKKKGSATVQRKEQTAGVPPVGSSVAANIQSLRGGGRPLPETTRAFFEPRFGADFSGVRVHSDERANAAARSIDAKAFTHGSAIAFASGQYSPGSREGQHLLAHELTHVVQQTGANQSNGPIQRKVDEQAFAKNGGKIEEVGDTAGGGFGQGVAESNEFLLWNYNVGSPEPRAEHTKYLKDKVSARWQSMLSADSDLRIAIVGGASTTGGTAVTTPLSVARADKIKAILVSAGIDAKRIVTSGVGSRHPFADETTSENMARNRRAEVFLFRPIKQVASQTGVSVTVTNLSAAVESGFNRDMSDPNRLLLRWRPFIFTADVEAKGPAGMSVGIIQFLRSDSRIGTYREPTGGTFLLDFGRCMQPDLPCKDLAESMSRFSGPGVLNGPGKGKVNMGDTPGNPTLINVRDPKVGTLIKAHWAMEFVAVLGALVGDEFLPVKFVVWRLEDDHARDSSGVLNPTKVEAKADAAQNGAPADLAIDKAMSGRTCRFMARRMNDFCKPELR